MMKTFWDWYGSKSSYKFFSLLLLIYMAIATLGKTGDYLETLKAVINFYCFWLLGKGSGRI